MTPEQVERLKRVAEAFAEQTPDLAADIRALLAEWEERGREVERLRASTLPDVVPEDVDALRDEVARLRHEVERRKGEVVAAEARLARCVEAGNHLRGFAAGTDLGKAYIEYWDAAAKGE